LAYDEQPLQYSLSAMTQIKSAWLASLAIAMIAGCTNIEHVSVQRRVTPSKQLVKAREAPNLFGSLLGHTEAKLDQKINAAWRHFFEGDASTERVYFEVDNDMAYIADIGNGDVRSEGISYGMMIAVQLDKRREFDRLWKWANVHMRHATGPSEGYFAWQCKFDGTKIDPGSASDGEEWFATALLMASRRWGNGDGIFNYGAQAQALLRVMRHKPAHSSVTAMFDPQHRQVVFAPTGQSATITDPSYHVPAFYELWAKRAEDPNDRVFWKAVTDESRAFFRRAAHPKTGLMPEYANFDGTPFEGDAFGAGKNHFQYDAWRTLANVGLDYAWWRADDWQVFQSNRVLGFLNSHGSVIPSLFKLDGTPIERQSGLGLLAMAAVAGHAADPPVARAFAERLWNAPLPTGKWRYYDGMLYFLGLLQAGGRFQSFDE
jgi:oligosaccharide reducing-end xylanase